MSGTQQPLLFINSQHHVVHRVENLETMIKMAKPPDETGISRCQILTLKYTTLVYMHGHVTCMYLHLIQAVLEACTLL